MITVNSKKFTKADAPLAEKTESFPRQTGFTLVELIVVIFGFSLIIVGLVGLISNLFTFNTQQSGLLSDVDQARKLAFQMAFELRNAQTASNGAYVLDTAGAQQIIFYSNIDNTPAIERIRYFVQNNQLWKGVTYYNGGGYNTAGETTSVAQNDLANGGNPVFNYFDGSYSGAANQPPLSQPVSVTAVKFVQINLQIYNKAGQIKTNIYTVTAGAAIRNLKTNLGQ